MTNAASPTTRMSGLRQALRAQGRKQRWLAERLTPPVAESVMSGWATGQIPIPPERVRQIAKILRVPQRDIQ